MHAIYYADVFEWVALSFFGLMDGPEKIQSRPIERARATGIAAEAITRTLPEIFKYDALVIRELN